MASLDNLLNKLYYNPSNQGSFCGATNLWRAVKENGFENVPFETITKWLQKQDAYTLHAPVRKKFVRNRVEVRGVDEIWEADLVDVQNLKKYNEGHRYLLTCIDILSKYAWVVPLKEKTGKNIVEAFQKITHGGRIPQMLHTDKGSEFMNREFQKFLRNRDIHFFTTENETKACIVERFNRTLKTRMWRYFTFTNTYKYIDILQKLVQSYNATLHSSIRMKPMDVNIENQQQALNALYGVKRRRRRTLVPKANNHFQFKIGDQVRISKNKLRFEKGYEANWSEEIFTISARKARRIPVYRVKDFNGDELQGTFYQHELQKVSKANGELYSVQKVLKTRKRKGKKQYFVRWKGYGEEFDSWVDQIEKR